LIGGYELMAVKAKKHISVYAVPLKWYEGANQPYRISCILCIYKEFKIWKYKEKKK
jgi:hypothetical protein